jgi:hypothetical protein
MFTTKELATRLAGGMTLMDEDITFQGPSADSMDISDEGLVISFEDGSEFRVLIEMIRGQ